LYKNHVRQETNNKIGGYVNISFLPKLEDVEEDENDEPLEKTDLYVQATLDTIQNCLIQGFQYKDIVVLVRKKAQGIAIANYLTEKKIPLLSSETLMIANATEVRQIIFVLKYLQNSNDLDSKANFLHYLATNAQSEMPIHDFIAKGMSFSIESEFENWLQNCNVNLSFSNIRKKSLYEAVEIITSKFLKPSLSPSGRAEAGNAYVQYFMDIVLERDIKSQAGISDFLIYWDKNAEKFSIPSPEGTNAVRIMTIHKSKGLEFPVVIFPFAEEDYNRKPKSKLWLNAEETTFGLPKVLIDNSKAIQGFGEEALEVYSQKKQEELLDNINVLYVALTRAEEQLFVISGMNLDKEKEPRKNNMSSFFINYLLKENVFDENRLEYEFGNKSKLSKEEIHIDTTKKIAVVCDVLEFRNIKIAQRESLMWGTQRQESIEYGNVVHEILSFIKTKNDVDLAIIKAIENGLITTNQKKTVEKSIREIVNHVDLGNCFSGDNIVLNEQTIIQNQGTTIKPDRMVISANNEVHLIDYKTGSHQPKYKLQLENYQTAIEKMGYKVTKKSLVYIGEEIEIVNL
jgi:ATP-dependent exoDNAse (exonuclease V) beta subunit